MLKYLQLLIICLIGTCSIHGQITILDESNHDFEKLPNLFNQSDHKALTNIEEALNEAFDNITSASTLAGFNAAVLLPDGTLWERASGISAVNPDTIPMTIENHMGMGSITKTFVSASLLSMMEDGLLTLEDSIGTYIGEYPNVDGSATIGQLLGMRTGFNDYLNENPAMGIALEENLDSIWHVDTVLNNYVLEPNFDVGDAWSYSNTNYLLAGKIIESISGRTWYDEVRSRIIEPLNLTNTFAYPWEGAGELNQANAFLDLDDNGTKEDLQSSGIPLEGFFSLASSAGCLVTRPQDLVHFMKAIFATDFLSTSTVEAMKEDQVRNFQFGFEYGLGQFSINSLPANNGHNGSIIYQSTAMYFSELDIAVSVQQNDGDIGQAFIDSDNVLAALVNQYIQCQNVSSTNDSNFNAHFTAYPNPTNNTITLELSNDLEIDLPINLSVLNNQGQLMQSQKINDVVTRIDLKDLPNGIYYFKIGNDFKKISVVK